MNSTIQKLLSTLSIAVGIAFPRIGLAQMTMDHSKMAMAQPAASLTNGEVKKVDLDAGKVTIKHGDIKHLDMPGMTMAFSVKDKSLLSSIKLGDKIKFMVVNEGGKMIVTDIQTVR